MNVTHWNLFICILSTSFEKSVNAVQAYLSLRAVTKTAILFSAVFNLYIHFSVFFALIGLIFDDVTDRRLLRQTVTS